MLQLLLFPTLKCLCHVWAMGREFELHRRLPVPKDEQAWVSALF